MLVCIPSWICELKSLDLPPPKVCTCLVQPEEVIPKGKPKRLIEKLRSMKRVDICLSWGNILIDIM